MLYIQILNNFSYVFKQNIILPTHVCSLVCVRLFGVFIFYNEQLPTSPTGSAPTHGSTEHLCFYSQAQILRTKVWINGLQIYRSTLNTLNCLDIFVSGPVGHIAEYQSSLTRTEGAVIVRCSINCYNVPRSTTN